jgi:DNA-binding MarR family transcriptional regulator
MNKDLQKLTMRNFQVVARKFRVLLDRHFREYHLNNKTIQIIRHIKREDGMTQKKLCESIKKDKAAIARGVAHLESIGLITRLAEENDKRTSKLYLSDKGEEILPVINQIHEDAIVAAMKNIDENSLKRLNETLDKIEKNLLNFNS